MSHFVVAVIHKPEEKIEDLMAPYQENNMGDCPKEYLAFNDEEDEMLERYNTDTETKYKSPTGELFSPYDNRFRREGAIGLSFGPNPSHVKPDDHEEVEVPFKQLYATFEEFADKYWGKKERDPEKKRYGYWENLNRKWDWYQVGGRWKDGLKLKPGASAFMEGEASWMMRNIDANGKPTKDGYSKALPDLADSAFIKDIDFEAMIEKKKYDAERDWEAGSKLAEDDSKRYWEYDMRKDETKEQFMARRCSWATWAVLMNGEWSEKGKMGWWGANLGTDQQEKDWYAAYPDLIKRLQAEYPDYVMTLVDCHI